MSDKNRHKEVDDLLKQIFKEDTLANYYPLKDLFELRLSILEITKNQATKILDIEHKTLDAVLTGDAGKVDFVTILKLSDFLEMPHEDILNKYFNLVRDTHSESIELTKKRSFLVSNFNLPSLKKMGLIESINDFDHIEEQINKFFGYFSVYEHSKHKITAAFSSAKRKTNKENLSFWYAAACQSFENTPNPNEYNRDALTEYFPQIRWHSMNVEKGLLLVTQALFKMGVTLILMPKFTTDLHVRGATLSYRDKPCIVITDYMGFYSSLWFALIHEIFHVLYDWEAIRIEGYHITGETESVKINEKEADDFARQYLFSKEKMEVIRPHINDPRRVAQFAEKNHVHPSIIYTFYDWDKFEENSYGKHKRFIPDYSALLEAFKLDEIKNLRSIPQITKERNLKILNK